MRHVSTPMEGSLITAGHKMFMGAFLTSYCPYIRLYTLQENDFVLQQQTFGTYVTRYGKSVPIR